MKIFRIRPIVGAGIVATFLPKSNANADAFGTHSGNDGYLADGNFHTYCYGSVAAARQGNADSAMQHLADYTDMSRSFDAACGSGTDVRYDDANLSGTVRGDYSCLTVDPGNGNVCSASRVRIDSAEIAAQAAAGQYENNINKTFRHETGHSVGMSHYSSSPTGGVDDCMKSGNINNDATWILYNQHHKDHVNNAY